MINYYKTINNKITELPSYERGCWVNLTSPTYKEIKFISDFFDVDSDSIKSALDEEERSRLEIEDNHTLILIDIPLDESDEKSVHYTTIPLGIILLDECIITVCTKKTNIINDFITHNIKDFYTFMKTRFIFQILHKNASYYLFYLRKINKMTTTIEKEIYSSMRNKQLIQLLELEKSLVYFSTSLKANELVLKKILRTQKVRKYEQDEDLLEDVIIENKQAVEMAKIYGDILSRIMDAFSAIISNNQNRVMQLLTSITLITTIPTIVSGLFGMNVEGIPYFEHPAGFWIVLSYTALICLLVTFFMLRKKLL
ncbi:MAG: magnesium transporter CorA family protein [Peptostreptococcaceae bacterium]